MEKFVNRLFHMATLLATKLLKLSGLNTWNSRRRKSNFCFKAFTIILALPMFFLRRSQRKMIARIPGLPSHIFYGNIPIALLRRTNLNELMMQAIHGVAKIFDKERIYRAWLAHEPVVMLYKPETVEALLSSNTIIEKSLEYSFLHSWLGAGLLTSTGNKWRQRRKMLTPSFHFRILEEFMPVFNEQAAVLVKQLHSCAHEDSLEVLQFITKCTLDIICETAMGVKINAQLDSDSEYVRAVKHVSESFFSRIMEPWLYLDIVFNNLPRGRKYKECLVTMHTFTRKVIRDRKAEFKAAALEDDSKSDGIGMKKRRAFLDLLLYQQSLDPTLTEEDIREEVDTFMFEGHDTTAMAISWTIFLLGHHPDKQEIVQQELDAIFDGDKERPIRTEELKEMKYLECCIKEALRLCPSVPFIGRQVNEDAVIGGYKIPAGTQCYAFIYLLHRDAEVFPQPERFKPERFFPENCKGRHPYAYVPFSAGPRNCIGQRFALNEEKVVLANVFRNFTIKSLDPRDTITVASELVLRPKKPLRVKVTPR